MCPDQETDMRLECADWAGMHQTPAAEASTDMHFTHHAHMCVPSAHRLADTQ